MRHFGSVHYGGWYKSQNTGHKRYYDFLGRLRDEFDSRGLYRKRDAVFSMIRKIADGKSPKEAQKASKTKGYSPPLYSDFNTAWEASQDTEALVQAFASGDDVAVMSGSGEFESGPSMQEMMQRHHAGQRSQGAGAAGPDSQMASQDVRMDAAASFEGTDASFFQRYKTPIVLTGTVAVLGGGLWFASRKGWI